MFGENKLSYKINYFLNKKKKLEKLYENTKQ